MPIAIAGLALGVGLIVMGMQNYYYEVTDTRDEKGKRKVVHINPAVEGNIFHIRPFNFWLALLAGCATWFFFKKVMK